jgi:hydroxymethylglutaryl-CoA lyase
MEQGTEESRFADIVMAEMPSLETPETVEIHEHGPRDGFQAEEQFIPTDTKVAVIDALSKTGVSSIQATSVVHPKAVPQLSDAEEVMARITRVPDVRYTVLVPNLRGAERAVPLEADGWELMLAVTDSYSLSNANRKTKDALREIEPVVEMAKEAAVELIGSMSTALGCPYEGQVPLERVLYVAEAYYQMGVRNISVADTVGVADPQLVYRTMTALKRALPEVNFGLHLHNTRGMALANVLAALQAGVTSFDTAVGGLGGSPFAAGATGNVSTEDLVHMLDLMRVKSGVDLDQVLSVSQEVSKVVDHPLESAVFRAGKASDLQPAPEGQNL